MIDKKPQDDNLEDELPEAEIPVDDSWTDVPSL